MNKPGDICISNTGYIYAAIGNACKVVRIAPTGQMDEIASDISSPVRISTDIFGNIFVVSSQLMTTVGFSIAKQLEVIEIKPDKSRQIIYAANASKLNANSSHMDILTGNWSASHEQADLSISITGDVYLTDPSVNKIIRIY